MNPVERVTEIKGFRAKRIFDAAGHLLRQAYRHGVARAGPFQHSGQRGGRGHGSTCVHGLGPGLLRAVQQRGDALGAYAV